MADIETAYALLEEAISRAKRIERDADPIDDQELSGYVYEVRRELEKLRGDVEGVMGALED